MKGTCIKVRFWDGVWGTLHVFQCQMVCILFSSYNPHVKVLEKWQELTIPKLNVRKKISLNFASNKIQIHDALDARCCQRLWVRDRDGFRTIVFWNLKLLCIFCREEFYCSFNSHSYGTIHSINLVLFIGLMELTSAQRNLKSWYWLVCAIRTETYLF